MNRNGFSQIKHGHGPKTKTSLWRVVLIVHLEVAFGLGFLRGKGWGMGERVGGTQVG